MTPENERQPVLFDMQPAVPSHADWTPPEHDLRGEDGPPTSPAAKPAPGPVRSRRTSSWRVRKHIHRRGRWRLSVQYWVLRKFADQGFITSSEIMRDADLHVQASARQRIRDCRARGLRIECDEFGDRCIWRISQQSRDVARQVVRRANLHSRSRPDGA